MDGCSKSLLKHRSSAALVGLLLALLTNLAWLPFVASAPGNTFLDVMRAGQKASRDIYLGRDEKTKSYRYEYHPGAYVFYPGAAVEEAKSDAEVDQNVDTIKGLAMPWSTRFQITSATLPLSWPLFLYSAILLTPVLLAHYRQYVRSTRVLSFVAGAVGTIALAACRHDYAVNAFGDVCIRYLVRFHSHLRNGWLTGIDSIRLLSTLGAILACVKLCFLHDRSIKTLLSSSSSTDPEDARSTANER